MSTTPPRLTVTSYALLAELALQPWSAYELAKQMRGNVRFIWSRAESRVYDEAKRLVALGLIDAEREFQGRRGRTVYTLAPAGRQALDAWLSTAPAAGFAMEYEALLRVFFGSLGDIDALRRATARIREDGAAMRRIGDVLAGEYAAGESPFQHEVHVRALTFDFLYGLASHLEAWAERTASEIASWEDVSPAGRQERALAIIAATRTRADAAPRRHPRRATP